MLVSSIAVRLIYIILLCKILHQFEGRVLDRSMVWPRINSTTRDLLVPWLGQRSSTVARYAPSSLTESQHGMNSWKFHEAGIVTACELHYGQQRNRRATDSRLCTQIGTGNC